jgi:predicted transcriptional regulator
MATKQQTVTVRVEPKLKRELQALAKAQRRTLSNLAEYFLYLGKLKYYEQDLAAARQDSQPKEVTP